MTTLEWEEVVTRFGEARNWWVHTTGKRGPHAVPVWGVAIDNSLIFYGTSTLVRSRNLAEDPRVVVHLESGEEPLILHGRAAPTGRAQDRPELVTAYREKYRRGGDRAYLLGMPYAEGVLAWEIEPGSALAWTVASPDAWSVRRWNSSAALAP